MTTTRVQCKHCQEQARFVKIDCGNFRDIHYCPACDRYGYAPDDFKYIEERSGVCEHDLPRGCCKICHAEKAKGQRA